MTKKEKEDKIFDRLIQEMYDESSDTLDKILSSDEIKLKSKNIILSRMIVIAKEMDNSDYLGILYEFQALCNLEVGAEGDGIAIAPSSTQSIDIWSPEAVSTGWPCDKIGEGTHNSVLSE